MNIMDFLEGQQDCADGKPHKSGRGEWYDRGYNAEYTSQQNKDWQTEQQMKEAHSE